MDTYSESVNIILNDIRMSEPQQRDVIVMVSSPSTHVEQPKIVFSIKFCRVFLKIYER